MRWHARPLWPCALAVLVALTIYGTGNNPASAVPPSPIKPVTTSFWVTVDGQTFSGPNESVALTGRVHIVTQVIPPTPIIPPDPIRVDINLADVHGIGLTSGFHYVAVGAVQTFVPPDPSVPPNPIIPATFTIMPVGVPPNPVTPPNPIVPIDLSISLAFDESWSLVEASANVENTTD